VNATLMLHMAPVPRTAPGRQRSLAEPQAELHDLKRELRKRLHDPVPEVALWLSSVLRGHYAYYGVPFNARALSRFRRQVVRLWFKALRRRSQKTKLTWKRMQRLQKYLPQPRIVHPHPGERLCVNT
jgi:RNA-directed DNA polymerase